MESPFVSMEPCARYDELVIENNRHFFNDNLSFASPTDKRSCIELGDEASVNQYLMKIKSPNKKSNKSNSRNCLSSQRNPKPSLEEKFRINLIKTRELKKESRASTASKGSQRSILRNIFFGSTEKMGFQQAKYSPNTDRMDSSYFGDKSSERNSPLFILTNIHQQKKNFVKDKSLILRDNSASPSNDYGAKNMNLRSSSKRKISDILRAIKVNMMKEENYLDQDIEKLSKLKSVENLIYKLSIAKKDYLNKKIRYDEKYDDEIKKVVYKREKELDNNLLKTGMIKGMMNNIPKKQYYIDDKKLKFSHISKGNDKLLVNYIKKVDRDIWGLISDQKIQKPLYMFDNADPVNNILNKFNEYYAPKSKKNYTIKTCNTYDSYTNNHDKSWFSRDTSEVFKTPQKIISKKDSLAKFKKLGQSRYERDTSNIGRKIEDNQNLPSNTTY